MKYDQIATTNYQGTVIAFARGIPETAEERASPFVDNLAASNLYFNVLALNPDDQDAIDWAGFHPIAFPSTVRPAGMQIINVPSVYNADADIAPLQDAKRHVVAKSSADYLYLFRESVSGSILVNRFRLVRKSDVRSGEVSFLLEPAWEVRFQRSGKPDTPADAKDVLNFLDPDKQPFLEPTLELFMMQAGSEATFDVELLPSASGGLSCQFFVVDPATHRVQLYNFPIDGNGDLVFTGKTFNADNRIVPDSSFLLAAELTGARLDIHGTPSAAYYQKQERVFDAAANGFLVKRTGRLALVMNGSLASGEKANDNTLVTVDFSVAVDGTLATPADTLIAGAIGPANSAAELGNQAYITFNGFALQSQFAFECWLCPASLTPDKQIIIGNGNDPAAPYMSLVNGSQIEAGFMGANGAPLNCTTSSGTIAQGRWNHVFVHFDEAASPQWQIRVNDAAIESTTAGTGDKPNGATIAQIGAPANGLVGNLDDLRIYNGGATAAHLVAEWPFDNIDYTSYPPTTPNSKDPKNPGSVFGAYLVPSASPTGADNVGVISYDSRNLTIFTSYFEDFSAYGQLNGSPYLLAASDGLLHCYFKGKDDTFCVLQYDSQAARAVFAAPWRTRDGSPETGLVQFVAAQSGAFMNCASIKITPLSDPALNDFFCDVQLRSTSGRVEKWMGVPRSLSAFASTLNGGSTGQPGDRGLANGSAVFYDVYGRFPAAYLPSTQSASAGQLALVTRIPERLPLKSARIHDVGADSANLTLEFHAPRWGTETTLTQLWPTVPTLVTDLIATLEGVSTHYPYGNPGYCNAKSYSLTAVSDLSMTNRVILWTHPSVSEVTRLEVEDGPQPDLCVVNMSLISDGQSLGATWQSVPRQQLTFARTLEKDNPSYDYASLATGDFAAIGALLIATTNGMSATVRNLVDTPKADVDMLAGASLFGAFPTAAVGSTERITAPIGPVLASSFQSAYYEQNGERVALVYGSEMFALTPDTVPHQGAVGLVQDTSSFSGGVASLVRQGAHGGWLDNPPQRCLDFASTNRVSMSVDENKAPGISQLTIQGDMSLELWCRPHRTKSASSQSYQRLLTFNRQTDPNDARTAVRYMAGLRDCPALKFKKDTTVRAAVESTQGTFYTWFAVDAVTTGIVGSVSTWGVTDPVLVVSVDANGHLQVSFGPDTKQNPIVSKEKIEAGTWYQVAVTYVYKQPGSGGWSIDAALYVNAQLQGTTTYTRATGELYLATLVLGDGSGGGNGLPMSVNEAAFFQRPLSPDTIRLFSEQRIPDNWPDMSYKWMFIDKSQDNVAVNSSATGVQFSPPILPTANWADKGLYFRPVLGYGATIGIATDSPIISGWNHLSLVHQAGYALKLDGTQFADCGHDNSLELGQAFALESWVQLTQGAAPPSQTLLAKGANAVDDYKLWITSDYRPVFECQIAAGDQQETVVIEGDQALDASRTHYLAVNFEVVTIRAQSGQGVKPQYELHIDLYVDGHVIARGVMDRKAPKQYRRYNDVPNLVNSKSNLNLGRTPTFGGSGHLIGYLSDTRIWSRTLLPAEITAAFASRRIPPNSDGLISGWRFNDGSGRTAFDTRGTNDARLSIAGLMVNFKPTSANRLYANGIPSNAIQYADSTSEVGGYGSQEQFNLCYVDSANPLGFYGQLDEVRIWNVQLTQEQITDSMYRPLSGNEANLKGLWGFERGSGTILSDSTGRGNDGTLLGTDAAGLPKWEASTAPLSNESSVTRNVLGGIPTFELRTIEGRPAVIDYADVQRDAYGAVFSVMKRGYFFVDAGELNLTTGFKVGDLSTVYIGQIQTDPKLVGFIEGGPPVPSENQTRPYWKGTLSEYTLYDSASSVEFEEAGETTYTYGVDRDASESDEFSMKGGLYVGGQFGTAEGIGFEVTERDLVFDGELGAQNKIESETHGKPGYEKKFGTARKISVEMAPGGAWEAGSNPSLWLNPVIGRRYVPCNVGCAVVKSLTADLYASVLTSTGMMVKMSIVPNPAIPEDVNLINFPIDPKYVKNGTLDGNVGFKPDPDVDPRTRSYFRPLEAYALKRTIERQEKQLEAYYLQFSADHYASQLINRTSWDDFTSTVTDNPAYDWARHISKRNIVNTYVWTAAGGTYAEEVSTMNVFSESYSATGSLAAGLGAVFDLKLAAPVAGPFVEIDYLHNWKAEVSVVRSKEQSAEFSLKANVSPDVLLSSPVFGPDAAIEFPESPTAGKVDGYRYMAYFLAPDNDHFIDFKETVVDPVWLNQSMDAAAAALRQATAADNGTWRILYRVTYVSRIPPSFQPAPAQSAAPVVQAPVNLAANNFIVQLVSMQIESTDPSPLDIGRAITKVLGTPRDFGVLATILPWWQKFITDSTQYTLPAASVLRALREDLLQYITALYASKNPK
ncbi:LamG domain-containing protein [Burkholderia contaminans]|uniref:LamG domain-containing protein n=2 Tax=Burkholderia contaminans TaxID=488447 RepID=UPI0006266C1E|nr:LamG domain-containing protein [Burkholderia contaminans]MEB4631492.1 LamG domain-containing protein [Burkholderia contaminans]MEB4637077.1 LamG domain-containing protein [Burkholderia contaminans]MEB4652161.1 LamG domain-containing protein [Burkholderia contaminans]MEB4665696.1 LamG domain-containing protein [Burkholderia contaminans]MEB4668022.1 LamG domain-containing protein [Burkholderia contaminans]